MPNGTHFEPQRTSVRAGRLGIVCKSGPHASALRLKIYKVSAIRQYVGGNTPNGVELCSPFEPVSMEARLIG